MDIFLDILLKPPQPLMGLFFVQILPYLVILMRLEVVLLSTIGLCLFLLSGVIAWHALLVWRAGRGISKVQILK